MTAWARRIVQSLLLAALTLGVAAAASAAIDEDDLLPIDEAYKLSVTASTRDRIEFTWTVAEGYYLYRHRMGAEAVDASFEAGPLDLPPGVKKTDEFFGEVETYRGAVTATLVGVAPATAATATFKVKYQGCADIGICYPPHTKTLTVELPQEASSALTLAARATPAGSPLGLGLQVGGALASATPGTESLPLPEDEAFQFEAIATSPVELLLRLTPAPGYYLYRDKTSLRLIDADGVALATPAWPAGEAHADEHFGEVRVYFDQIEVPLALRRSRAEAGPLTLEANFQGCQTDGICYPPMTRRIALDLPAAGADQLVSTAQLRDTENAPQSGGIGTTSLLLALVFALGGGLILNLMPCVLPVLSLKALSLAASGESREKARAHALWYTFGVLASFAALGALALGLRQAGLALGWGFQLQQPLVVGLLAYLMAAIGLSLSGVFSIGAGWAGMGQSLTERSGPAGDFFTGVLAVIVASPCTAPFMGTALAFAFASGPVVAIAVFLALGLGLALPFLLIGFVPALATRLPKPGAWMETFKQLLAFPMYLTAAWLLWVLGKQRGVDAIGWALAGLVLLALALWWRERARWSGRRVQRALALLLAVAALWPLWQAHRLTPPSSVPVADGTEPYSATRLAELREAGRTVFVNMTADWCVTCKANEKRVLDTDAFRAALAQRDAVYMKGDWTDVDPEITRFLEAHDSVGVPLYVVYTPADTRGPGTVLPTVLTQGAIDAALAGTAP
ncbi:protein-disulfide reductase DsbD family protein [Chiayiivirga flava]|uniref:Thiol:disulfide interchange protein DsbD n=1 Tax=Chiayiivirga flava TaxID=659595 RepID=A0A7W8DBL5_9GAMM|nr:protein-disulfide reductase DsbD [Chiayiivirga flava]MBB5209718.1 thiol:disulfide interchange protein DsbD [Chiayiivirga flava]